MIISRTPLRISFCGGGSDMAQFYRECGGGAVLSTSVDKYVYVTANRKFDNGIRVAYSKTEEVGTVDQVEHKLVRAALGHLGVRGGVEITTIADIPSRGTGLGSSSSFTVALLHALAAFGGRHVSKETLAADACKIEIELCGEPIGKQDQYAAAYGGLNLIEFMPDDVVRVSPIVCSSETLEALNARLLVLYTGITRSASNLLKDQNEAIRNRASVRRALQRMVAMTYQLCSQLQENDLSNFGEILHEGWELKKNLTSGVSTSEIDGWYSQARAAGALGGKILGAGAGGFLLLYAPEDRHDDIRRGLPALRPVPMRFERFGSQVIFYNPT